MRVAYGQTLMFTAGATRQPDRLVVVPAVNDAHNQPTTPAGGCWQYTTEDVTVRAIRDASARSSRESLLAEFAVYDR